MENDESRSKISGRIRHDGRMTAEDRTPGRSASGPRCRRIEEINELGPLLITDVRGWEFDDVLVSNIHIQSVNSQPML